MGRKSKRKWTSWSCWSENKTVPTENRPNSIDCRIAALSFVTSLAWQRRVGAVSISITLEPSNHATESPSIYLRFTCDSPSIRSLRRFEYSAGDRCDDCAANRSRCSRREETSREYRERIEPVGSIANASMLVRYCAQLEMSDTKRRV